MEDVERFQAPGGVLRMLLGFACGLAVGALVALVLPRDDGPRRRHLVFDELETGPDDEVHDRTGGPCSPSESD